MVTVWSIERERMPLRFTLSPQIWSVCTPGEEEHVSTEESEEDADALDTRILHSTWKE